MSKSMRTGHGAQSEAIDKGSRRTLFLVDFDRVAVTHQAEFAMIGLQPAANLRSLSVHDYKSMVYANFKSSLPVKRAVQLIVQAVPVIFEIGVIEGKLGLAPADGVSVDRDTRAVGPPICHLDQHIGDMQTQAAFNGCRLRKQSDYSAQDGDLQASAKTTLRCYKW